MRKRMMFIIAALAFGAATALGVFGILGAVAVPAYTTMPLTPDEIHDYELMAEQFSLVVKYPEIVMVLFSVMAAVMLALLLMVLNPELGLKTIKNRTSVLKAIAVIVVTVIIGVLMAMLEPEAAFFPVRVAVLMGLLWAVAGREGWAGDFNSWQSGADLKGLATSSALGAATGFFVAAVFKFNSWAFGKYFMLVSEVLDGSGETSYLGFVYFLKGMLFMFTLSFGVVAGLIIVLAPARMKMTERARWALVPVVLALVLFGVSMSMYQDAVARYDLGASDLNGAAGLSGELPAARTLVVLGPASEEAPVVQQKERTINAGWFGGSSEVAATEDNLRFIEQFIKERPDGSVYLYAARNGYSKLLFSLWRPDEARQVMKESAKDMLLPRLLLIRHLQYGQVTEQNAQILRWYTWDGPFVLKGEMLARVGKAALHMGEIETARALKTQADEEGVDTGELVIPDEPPVIDGSISGRISLNGVSMPEGTLVGLFARHECGAGLEEISEFTSESWMVNAVPVGSDGAFSFDRLGEGGYALVLNADSEVVPSDKELVSLSNDPGPLCINGTAPSIDVGEVVIQVN